MDLLLEHFDLSFGTPDGIEKLRELILKLGMQGKLSKENQEDEPVDILIQRINLEKNKSQKNKRTNTPILESEYLYSIPKNWKWIRLNDFLDVRDGTHDTPKYFQSGIPLITSKNLYSGLLDFDNIKFISESDHIKISERSKVDKYDILFAMIGSIGNPVIVDTDREFSIKNVALLKYYNLSNYNVKFIHYYLQLAQQDIKLKASGAVQSFVSLNFLRNYPFPLPPLNEQKRIVEKIDELMRLCDLLEKQRDSKNVLLLKINSSAINKLHKAEDEYSLAEAWQFIQNQFELIFSDKKNVFDLKEVILNLAMRGKLSTSDINDIPASILMTTIEEERKSLIKQKIISKQKELPKIGDTEKKYNLPLGWEWVRLNEYGIWKSGSTPSRTNQSFYGGDIPWVKSGEVKQGRIKETSETITELAIEKCSLHRNPIGSVLIAMYGANIGEVGVLEIEAATNQAVCACKTYSPIYNEFLYYLLLSLRTNFISQGAGAAQPNISREKIINTVVPLPPFDEQKRIVEKIKKLFQLADLFESKIEESSNKQVQILNSVLANI